MGRAKGATAAVSAARMPRRTGGFRSVQDAVRVLGERAATPFIALGRHHPYTGTHSLRVANLVELTCDAMRLPDAEKSRCVQTALLHDVGKATIPVALLDGASALTDAEWALLQTHSAAGHALVFSSSGDSELAGAVRGVHERVDGAGYPEGLRGDSIPLAARVVAVCDAYEAMTCQERNYREPMSSSEARATLAALAGSKFDATVVERFCAALEACEANRSLRSLLG